MVRAKQKVKRLEFTTVPVPEKEKKKQPPKNLIRGLNTPSEDLQRPLGTTNSHAPTLESGSNSSAQPWNQRSILLTPRSSDSRIVLQPKTPIPPVTSTALIDVPTPTPIRPQDVSDTVPTASAVSLVPASPFLPKQAAKQAPKQTAKQAPKKVRSRGRTLHREGAEERSRSSSPKEDFTEAEIAAMNHFNIPSADFKDGLSIFELRLLLKIEDINATSCDCVFHVDTDSTTRDSDFHSSKLSYNLKNFRFNANRHLRRWHLQLFCQMIVNKRNGVEFVLTVQTVCSEWTRKSEVNASIDRVRKLLLNKPDIGTATVAFAVASCCNGVAFRVGDSSTFRDFFNSCGIQVQSESSIRKSTIPAIYAAVERIEEEKLKKASSVSFAFDGWSCAAGRTVGIAYYFIDEDWNLQHCFLDLVSVWETSNAATISSVVAARLKRRIGQSTVISMAVTDNCSTEISAANSIALQVWTCVIHICNLAVEKCFEDIEELGNLIKKLLLLFAWLRTANVEPVLGIALKLDDKNSKIKATTFGKTRWNGKLLMISKYLKIKTAVSNVRQSFEGGKSVSEVAEERSQRQEHERAREREHAPASIFLSTPSTPFPDREEVPPANPSSFFFDQTEDAVLEVLAKILNEIHVFTLIAEREECTISSVAYLLHKLLDWVISFSSLLLCYILTMLA